MFYGTAIFTQFGKHGKEKNPLPLREPNPIYWFFAS
jgi:hypothetical protein